MSRIHLESIEIFDELPGKCGCPTDLLDEIESSLGGLLPPLYRRLMLSDAQRMANTLHLVHPSRLTDERMVIDNLLADEQEAYTFRLDQTQLVVAHDETGFDFLDVNCGDSTPVYRFDTEDESEIVLPAIDSGSFVEYISLRIRRFLNLPYNQPP